MTNETAKVKLPDITDYLAIPVRHTRSCSFSIDGSGPDSDFCDCGFSLRRDAKTRAQGELLAAINSHTALIEAARAALDTLQHIADRGESRGVTQAYLGAVAKTRAGTLRTALEKVKL